MRHTLISSFAAALVLVACGNNSMTKAQREPDEYLGCATDENWRTLDDKELTNQVMTDDAEAPVFDVPSTSGTTIPFASKPTLSWELSSTVTGKPSGTAACTMCPTCGALLPEHLPPVSGDVYDMQFSVDGAVAYRVLTTFQSYSPPDNVWASWRGKTVSLVSIRTQLKVNDVVAGPFKSTSPLTFTVGS